jgi:hypothetical protein
VAGDNVSEWIHYRQFWAVSRAHSLPTFSPRILNTSTLDANSFAYHFVSDPRLRVVRPLGVWCLTSHSVLPLLVWYVSIVATVQFLSGVCVNLSYGAGGRHVAVDAGHDAVR